MRGLYEAEAKLQANDIAGHDDDSQRAAHRHAASGDRRDDDSGNGHVGRRRRIRPTQPACCSARRRSGRLVAVSGCPTCAGSFASTVARTIRFSRRATTSRAASTAPTRISRCRAASRSIRCSRAVWIERHSTAIGLNERPGPRDCGPGLSRFTRGSRSPNQGHIFALLSLAPSQGR